MATEVLELTTTWEVLATGPGNVSFEAKDAGAEWALSTDQLAFGDGHTIPIRTTTTAALASGEVLYVRGVGTLVRTFTT